MGVSILKNKLKTHIITYNSIGYKCFYGVGDMLIGSKISPQADIIKFIIAGGYDFSTCGTQYVNLMFFCLHVTFPITAGNMAS